MPKYNYRYALFRAHSEREERVWWEDSNDFRVLVVLAYTESRDYVADYWWIVDREDGSAVQIIKDGLPTEEITRQYEKLLYGEEPPEYVDVDKAIEESAGHAPAGAFALPLAAAEQEEPGEVGSSEVAPVSPLKIAFKPDRCDCGTTRRHVDAFVEFCLVGYLSVCDTCERPPILTITELSDDDYGYIVGFDPDGGRHTLPSTITSTDILAAYQQYQEGEGRLK